MNIKNNLRYKTSSEKIGKISDKNESILEAILEEKSSIDKLVESYSNSNKLLKQIVESVCDNIMKEFTEPEGEEVVEEVEEQPVVESFNAMLARIIKEEVTNLNVFGKHPGYRKKPMTTPANKEVVKTSGDKDWNDDSVKGEQPFGQKIGSSAPFDEKVVSMLTDAVMKSVKESIKKK